MRKNADQNNSEYGHFSRSDSYVSETLKIKDLFSIMLVSINSQFYENLIESAVPYYSSKIWFFLI